jgi:hypothetical protein
VSLWVKFKRAFAPKHAVFEKRLHQARMPALTPGAPLVRFEAERLVRQATAESESPKVRLAASGTISFALD